MILSMQLKHLPGALRAWWKFKDYRPLRVTPLAVLSWLSQYPAELRTALLSLLNGIEFIGEKEIEAALVAGNDEICRRLAEDGVGPSQIIYVQHDEAGSSSPVMLNLLRDAALLERSGAKFVDGRDQVKLSEVSAEIGTGAIIYVDDFAGTGTQLVGSRNWASQFVAGSFSEFFLGVVVCEEAKTNFEAVQITPVAARFHSVSERPLREECSSFPPQVRQAIGREALGRFGKYWCGFRKLGTNIVLYRNAPNSTPVIFRGNVGQEPTAGILPRTTDLTKV